MKYTSRLGSPRAGNPGTSPAPPRLRSPSGEIPASMYRFPMFSSFFIKRTPYLREDVVADLSLVTIKLILSAGATTAAFMAQSRRRKRFQPHLPHYTTSPYVHRCCRVRTLRQQLEGLRHCLWRHTDATTCAGRVLPSVLERIRGLVGAVVNGLADVAQPSH